MRKLQRQVLRSLVPELTTSRRRLAAGSGTKLKCCAATSLSSTIHENYTGT